MSGPLARLLPDGRRLHLQHGPIDLIVEAWGPDAEAARAYDRAAARFATLLDELVAELPALRRPAGPAGRRFTGPVAARMEGAVQPLAAGGVFLTPMAAVAGAVADEVLAALVSGGRLAKAYVNNGGDAALYFGGDASDAWLPHIVPARGSQQSTPTPSAFGSHLSPCPGERKGASFEPSGPLPLPHLAVGERWLAGGETERGAAPSSRDRSSRGSTGKADASLTLAIAGTGQGLADRLTVRAGDGARGVATSGWRGRSFSLGIADAVTVLAETAAAADAAATLVANAVDLPGHPAVARAPADTLSPDSDLGGRLVTVDVGALSAREVERALESGLAAAEGLRRAGRIEGAALFLAGGWRACGGPRLAVTREIGTREGVHA